MRIAHDLPVLSETELACLERISTVLVETLGATRS
jgi:hypothetical protein